MDSGVLVPNEQSLLVVVAEERAALEFGGAVPREAHGRGVLDALNELPLRDALFASKFEAATLVLKTCVRLGRCCRVRLHCQHV